MTRTSHAATEAFLAIAHELADAGGKAILPHFRTAVPTTNKAAAGFDPVTAADMAAERAIRKIIRARCPDHTIVGEEFGTTAGTGRYTWVIDPIDGTKGFITGFPLWGVLIGLKDGDEAIVGMMEQPYTGERFWGTAKGAFCRRGAEKAKRLITRACGAMGDAILATTSPDMFKGREKTAFERVAKAARMTRYGGDCYAYAMLAAGQIDLVIEAGLKDVDIVALIPIIEQAGGRVTAWDGGTALHGGRVVAAGDAKMHAAAMALLAG